MLASFSTNHIRIAPEVEAVEADAHLFAMTARGVVGFKGADARLLGSVIRTVGGLGQATTRAAALSALGGEMAPPVAQQCLDLLQLRGVLEDPRDDEGQVDELNPDLRADELLLPHEGGTDLRRVLIIGAGRLAAEARSACRSNGTDVQSLPRVGWCDTAEIQEQRQRQVLYRLAADPGSTAVLDSVGGAAIREAVATSDLVVTAIEGEPLQILRKLRDVCVEMDRPLLVLLASGKSIRVCPLLLPHHASRLEDALGCRGHEGLVELLLAPQARSISSGVVEQLTSVLSHVLFDPSSKLAWRSLRVQEDGVYAYPVPFAGRGPDPESMSRSSFLPTYLSKRISENPQGLEWVREKLQENGLVVIPNAFDTAYAEAVHEDLQRAKSWNSTRHRSAHHQYTHDHMMTTRLTPALRTFRESVRSRSSRQWIESLCGRPCDGEAEVQATWHLPGDYAGVHTGSGGQRSVALCWHLTKDWDDSWGGDMVWHMSGTVLKPSFNTLCLYRVDSCHSLHAVLPVNPLAQGRRMAVTAWWSGGERAEWNIERNGAGRPGIVATSAIAPVALGGGVHAFRGFDEIATPSRDQLDG